MTVSTSSSRHLLLRLDASGRLPEALLSTLRDEVVLCGWLRASGVLADVELRAYDARTGGLGASRRIAGPTQVVSLEGSIGLSNGDVSCGLRAVLARETETGLETVAGEIVDARVVALEGWVTVLDDVAAVRQLDKSGVWLLEASASSPTPRAAPVAAAPAPAAPAPAPAPSSPTLEPRPAATPSASTWADAAARAAEPDPPPKPAPAPAPAPAARPAATPSMGVMPLRPVRAAVRQEEDQPFPEEGDTVEHFAFGRCDVVKSDGDRLHVRVGKEGRVKEIAVEMLRVTPLPPMEGQTSRHFRLDRKL